MANLNEILLQTLRNMSPAAANRRGEEMQEERESDARRRIFENFGSEENYRDFGMAPQRPNFLIRGLRGLGGGARGIAERIPGTGPYGNRKRKAIDTSNTGLSTLRGRSARELDPNRNAEILNQLKSLKNN